MTDQDLLSRFAPPRAPQALRARVLQKAGAAAAAAVPPSRTDRIWFSTRWRLAWATALAAMVLLEVLFLRDTEAPMPSIPQMREADAAAIAVGLRPAGYLGDRVVNERAFLFGVEEPR